MSAAVPAAPNLPVSQALRRASGQPGPGGWGVRTASRPAEAGGAAVRRSAAKPARAGRPAGPPSGPRARPPATPRCPRGRPSPARRGERTCERLAEGLGCPGGLRPLRSVVAEPAKPGLGRGTDAPKVTPGDGQGGRGRWPVQAVRGMPRPGFCSPLTPSPLCARAAASLASLRVCPGRVAEPPGLTALGAAGAGRGSAHPGLSLVGPRLPVVGGGAGALRPAAGPAPRAPALGSGARSLLLEV